VISVGLRIEHLGRSSVRYAIGLFADDQEVAAADGFFVHVYVDRHTRRPVPISDSLRQAMSALQG
ncbi:MAG: acyl-CoA thioesterase, partial [Pseudomonadota bacterium]|nr:acyl-CoA thioesterase [Pseudomonadota bacterium]